MCRSWSRARRGARCGPPPLPGQPRFQAADVRFLSAIATRLAQVLGRAELFSRVSQLAYEDSLTGLANRRGAAGGAWSGRPPARPRRRRPDGPHLRHRRPEGDQRRPRPRGRRPGAAAGGRRRWWPPRRAGRSSTVGRLSGDEFCVLLEGGDLAAAEEVAGAALAALGAERDMRLSISCGAAQAGPGTETPEQLLRAADAAQYAAKRRGGGQFCTAAGAAAALDHEPAASGRLRRRLASAARRPPRWRLWTAACATRARSTASRWSHGRSARATNAASWTVSRAAAGSGLIESVVVADDRDDRLRGLRWALATRSTPWPTFPPPRASIRAGAGSFVCRRGDPGADPAEAGAAGQPGPRRGAGGRRQRPCTAPGWWSCTATRSRRARGGRARAEPAGPGRAARRRGRARSQRRSHHLEAISAITAAVAELTRTRTPSSRRPSTSCGGRSAGRCARSCACNDDHLELAAHASAVDLSFDWSQPREAGLIGRCLRELRPVMADDVRAEPDYRVYEHDLEHALGAGRARSWSTASPGA